jgi:hypothetical protein
LQTGLDRKSTDELICLSGKISRAVRACRQAWRCSARPKPSRLLVEHHGKHPSQAERMPLQPFNHLAE